MKDTFLGLLRVALLACALALPGCVGGARPVPVIAPTATETISGVVTWNASAPRQAQVQISEIASGATVSLIDLVSGITVASTVTLPDGKFTLELAGWQPTPGQPYGLEAIKGLQAGGKANRVGASAARLRTIITKQTEGWTSVTGGRISISPATTTAAAIADLLSFDKAALLGLLGGLEVAQSKLAGAGVTAERYEEALGAVDRALGSNRDPLRALVRDAQTGAFALMDRPALITGVSKSQVKPGETFEIFGNGFSLVAAFNNVFVGGAEASQVEVDATGTKLTVTAAQTAAGRASSLVVDATSLAVPVTVKAGSGLISLVAGSYARGFSGDGGPATAARFAFPGPIAFDSRGNMYIGDLDNSRIRKVDSTGIISTFAGNGSGAFSGDGGQALGAGLTPCGLAMDASDNLYVGDCVHGVRKIAPDGVITTIAGNGTVGATSGDGGPATSATFVFAGALALDSTGNLYVCDTWGQRIRKIDKNGVITTFAGTGTAGNATEGAAAATSPVSSPEAIVAGTSGNLYFTDADNARVKKIAADGKITTVAGMGATGFGGDGGPAIQAALNYPVGLALDGAGDLFISDSRNHRIRKVALATDATITTVAGLGIDTVFGDGGPAIFAALGRPRFLAFDQGGALFISSGGYHNVRKLD